MSQTASTSPEGIINVPVSPSKQQRKKLIFLLFGLLVIAGGISYFLWHSQQQGTANVLKVSGRIEGYETDIGVKRSGRIVAIAVPGGGSSQEGARINPVG